MKSIFLIILLTLSAAAIAQTVPDTNAGGHKTVHPFNREKNIHNPQNVALIDEQLAAYNRRDLTGFLRPYSDDIKIYNFPNALSGEGKDYMTKVYGNFFKTTPNLHCEIVNRTVLGETVIDHEKVSGLAGGASMEAIAIYKIKNNKIIEVYFIGE